MFDNLKIRLTTHLNRRRNKLLSSIIVNQKVEKTYTELTLNSYNISSKQCVNRKQLDKTNSPQYRNRTTRQLPKYRAISLARYN